MEARRLRYECTAGADTSPQAPRRKRRKAEAVRWLASCGVHAVAACTQHQNVVVQICLLRRKRRKAEAVRWPISCGALAIGALHTCVVRHQNVSSQVHFSQWNSRIVEAVRRPASCGAHAMAAWKRYNFCLRRLLIVSGAAKAGRQSTGALCRLASEKCAARSTAELDSNQSIQLRPTCLSGVQRSIPGSTACSLGQQILQIRLRKRR